MEITNNIGEIIFSLIFILLILVLTYSYIRMSIAKDKENKLLKEKMDFDLLKNELNSYKQAVKAVEMYVDREDGKRVGINSSDDKVLGILSRLGFTINSIKDVEEHKGKKEINFKLNGKDLVSAFSPDKQQDEFFI